MASKTKGKESTKGKARKPVSKPIPDTPATDQRVPGALKGRIRIHADLDTLPDDIALALGIEDAGPHPQKPT